MTELKTRPTGESVEAFLEGGCDDDRRPDCLALVEIMTRLTGAGPVMWSTGIVGFGSYHYRTKSGQEGDWYLVGFAPRKRELALYIMAGFEQYDDLLARLGTYRVGKSCLYIKKLADVDQAVLEQLIAASVSFLRRLWPS